MKSPNRIHTPKPLRLLLFYKFVSLPNFELYAEKHLAFCRALGIRGRILVAAEGINGTLTGTPDQCDAYMNALQMDERFADVMFKVDEVHEHQFPRISVKPVKSLINFGEADGLDPNDVTGEHLEPMRFFEELRDEEVIVLDGRTDYEWDEGHFKNAIRPDVKTFREFPKWIRKHFKDYKNKRVLTYCTGGIRCEKLTGYLINEGFENVAQLRGGIVAYLKDEHTDKDLFEGKMYVFDDRISIDKKEAAEGEIRE